MCCPAEAHGDSIAVESMETTCKLRRDGSRPNLWLARDSGVGPCRLGARWPRVHGRHGRVCLAATRCALRAACCTPAPLTCCLLPSCCLLPAACCLLPAACCLLPAACCLLCPASPPVSCALLLGHRLLRLLLCPASPLLLCAYGLLPVNVIACCVSSCVLRLLSSCVRTVCCLSM